MILVRWQQDGLRERHEAQLAEHAELEEARVARENLLAALEAARAPGAESSAAGIAARPIDGRDLCPLTRGILPCSTEFGLPDGLNLQPVQVPVMKRTGWSSGTLSGRELSSD